MKGRGAVGLAAATPPRGPSRDLPACFMWPSLISPGGEKHRKLLREKNPGECQQTDLIKCQTREKLSSTQRNPAQTKPVVKLTYTKLVVKLTYTQLVLKLIYTKPVVKLT